MSSLATVLSLYTPVVPKDAKVSAVTWKDMTDAQRKVERVAIRGQMSPVEKHEDDLAFAAVQKNVTRDAESKARDARLKNDKGEMKEAQIKAAKEAEPKSKEQRKVAAKAVKPKKT